MGGPLARARKALKVRSLIGSWLAPPPRPRPPCAGVSWAKAQSEKHNRSGSILMGGSISHALEHRAEKRGACGSSRYRYADNAGYRAAFGRPLGRTFVRVYARSADNVSPNT